MRILLHKELLALIRDSRLLSLALVFVVLFISVLTTTYYKIQKSQEEKIIATQAMQIQWDNQGDKHPHRGAHLGVYVFAPESSLSAFDPGINHYLGQILLLEPHKRNMMRFSKEDDSLFSNNLGEFTPTFILISLLPLLIIGMTYNSISLEKETGTLRLLRASGQNFYDIIFAKFLVQFLAIAFLLLVAISPIFILIGLNGGVFLWESITQTLALFISYLLYSSVFIAIGLIISTYASSSRQALMLLIAVWVLFIFIMPRVASTSASATLALPSATEFWNNIHHDYTNGLPGEDNRTTRMNHFEADLMQKYNVHKLENIPVGLHALKRMHQEEYSNKVHEFHFNLLWDKYTSHEDTLRAFSFMSPTMTMRLLSMKLAGTDLMHRRHFEDQSELYRRYYVKHLDAWDANNTKGLSSYANRYGNDALWQSIEHFNYIQPDLGYVLRNATKDMTYLLLWVFISMILLSLSVRRISI